MKRTWTIIGVGDVPAASNGTRRCSVSRLPFLPMITLGKSSIQMERSCSVSTMGRPRASLIDESRSRDTRQRAPVVLPSR